jgi:hypothetical protein
MSDILIRNIPEETLKRLKLKAARQNRSLQQELHGIIIQAANDDVEALIDRIRERRVSYEVSGKTVEDSTLMIRRDRSR